MAKDRKIMVGADDKGETVFGVLEGAKLIHSTADFSEARSEAGEDAPFEDWTGLPLIHPSELVEYLSNG